MTSGSKPVVSIDFGTSTSLVARPDGVVPIGDLQPWLSSAVGFDPDLVVGEETDDLLDEQIVRSVKRTITLRQQQIRVETPPDITHVAADDIIAKIMLSTETRHPVALPRRLFGIPSIWYEREQLEAVRAARSIQAGRE